MTKTTAGSRHRSADEREHERLIHLARQDPDSGAALVRLLDERAPHHHGRSTASTNRLRARVFIEFGDLGLPSAAMPFVLEELESGLDPSTVAAAGRALLGATEPLPTDAGPLLVSAIERLRGNDEEVRFLAANVGTILPTAIEDLTGTIEQLGPSAAPARAALAELLEHHQCCFNPAVRTRLEAALHRLGSEDRPPCCHAPSDTHEPSTAPGGNDATLTTDLTTLVLEDQDGNRASFAERFHGRATAITFFYTRCTNPQRCSLTVARLASLARRIDDARLDCGVAGISYDPRYDRPDRLRTYGAERGMTFSPRCSLLRTIGPFEPLIDALDLGVGFGPVTVNQHRLDLMVVDSDLCVRAHRTRRLWSEDDVLADLNAATGVTRAQ
ncbi:MAG TPA: SCO family protein [Microthrixaceae bacterium]|nr:SCO family protein [Microthrixaceae bacterium]